MTIQFFIFTVQVSKRKRKKYPSLPGYSPCEIEKNIDRKAAFLHYN
ncbi:hypothetical protein Q7A53_18380 [Halobacillus rhizosphaerae]